MAFLTVILIVSSIYYLPYFISYNKSSSIMTYWWTSQENYIAGIFDSIPTTLNFIFSILILGISKLLYIVCLRPSYSNVPLVLVSLRAIGGLVMLPGILYMLIRSEQIEKIFLLLFLIPILIGASQERYLLPICPILIFYGIRCWKKILFKN